MQSKRPKNSIKTHMQRNNAKDDAVWGGVEASSQPITPAVAALAEKHNAVIRKIREIPPWEWGGEFLELEPQVLRFLLKTHGKLNRVEFPGV